MPLSSLPDDVARLAMTRLEWRFRRTALYLLAILWALTGTLSGAFSVGQRDLFEFALFAGGLTLMCFIALAWALGQLLEHQVVAQDDDLIQILGRGTPSLRCALALRSVQGFITAGQAQFIASRETAPVRR